MSDQNTQATQDQTTTRAKLYTTKDEALANKPTDGSKNLKPFEVLHNGTSKGWVMARGYDHALAQLARLDGYSVSTGGSAPVTKEVIAAKLGEFTDAELKALGLTRQKTARK